MTEVKKTIEQTVYVANDGREFTNRTDCVRYDAQNCLFKDVKAGDHILLSDGLVNLEVVSVEGEDIHTKILNSGKMSDRKRRLFDKLITPGEEMPTKLTEQDILSLFDGK